MLRRKYITWSSRTASFFHTSRHAVVGSWRRPALVEEKFYVTSTPPPAYWGQIQVEHIVGKGRGLVACEDLEPGQLLMVSEPLVMIEGKDMIPEAEDLVAHMLQRQFTASELGQLLDLHDGVTEPGSSASSSSSSSSSSEGGQGGEGEVEDGEVASVSGAELNVEQLYRITVLNSFGEDAPDIPAAIMRKDPLTPHLGLWPKFSLLNHSCAANAANLVIGGNMLVRATRHISQGEEVCINYLGRGVLAPLGERQIQLEEGFGFTCACSRCLMEQGRQAAFGEAVAEVKRVVERDLQPDLEVAAQRDDEGMVQAVVAQIQNLVTAIEEQAREVGCSKSEGAWLRAGAYEAYSLLASAAELEPVTWNERASLACQSIINEVGPGSDLHVLLTTRHLSLVQQKFDPLGPEAQRALESCRQAYQLRYGRVDARVLEELVKSGAKAVERVLL